MRALLDDCEVVDPAESPNLGELGGEQFAKKRADADVGKVIAASANLRAVARVIAIFGMIKRLLHEPRERLRATSLYFVANELNQFGLQSENVESLKPSVQRSKPSI